MSIIIVHDGILSLVQCMCDRRVHNPIVLQLLCIKNVSCILHSTISDYPPPPPFLQEEGEKIGIINPVLSDAQTRKMTKTSLFGYF